MTSAHSLVTFACPNIPAHGLAAFRSRRAYYFRLSVSRRPVSEALSLSLLRSLWHVATSKALSS